jgi:hypothetical protein
MPACFFVRSVFVAVMMSSAFTPLVINVFAPFST